MTNDPRWYSDDEGEPATRSETYGFFGALVASMIILGSLIYLVWRCLA